MESEPRQDAPRKFKFKPKAPVQRAPKPEVKSEKVEEDVDAVQAADLMRQFHERSNRAKIKVEKKVRASQIAFGFGAASTSLKSYGVPKGGSTSNQGHALGVNVGAHPSDPRDKEYNEPWDYYSYYPVTLPMRRPYSGNPAILDEEEFGEASASVTFDESAINHVSELGLMAENAEANMFFLQLPPTLPMTKRSATADGQLSSESTRLSGSAHAMEKTCRLDNLTAGLMGKMLVYKSGAVKLKLGETLYDVSPGMDCVFAQDLVAVNTMEKHCCAIAEINKRAIITPDVDAILNSVTNL
ncbi:hypothetical protein K2173_017336 [Erythroxylum novogranatense]|uniref:DNA-directed RNA polymerase III subunit RPC4 n=1 Tax=Erythroxylum novogranatense TaxID=1862640 RepID=A0AAV8TK63_9ROSI|nr:hypothetical protein K2173_017336 [Erythroxylum novogranatense]